MRWVLMLMLAGCGGTTVETKQAQAERCWPNGTRLEVYVHPDHTWSWVPVGGAQPVDCGCCVPDADK